MPAPPGPRHPLLRRYGGVSAPRLSPRRANGFQTDGNAAGMGSRPALVSNPSVVFGSGGAWMDGDTEVGAAGGAWCWTFGEAEFDEGRWQLRVRGEPVD